MHNILESWHHSITSPRMIAKIREQGQHMEDIYFGMISEDIRSFFIGCTRFAWLAQWYMPGWNGGRDAGPMEPITIHKASALSPAMKADIPDRICGTPDWKCKDRSTGAHVESR